MPKITSKLRVKKPFQGRRKPFGWTKRHYIVLPLPQVPHGAVMTSNYRVRHTYQSLWNWLVKSLNARRFYSRRTAEKFAREQWQKEPTQLNSQTSSLTL